MLFKSTVRTSVPKARKVCGYTIQRLPFGAYLQAAERLPGLLSETAKECFPGMEPADVLEMLKHIKESEIAALVTRIVAVAPKHLLGIVSDLSGIPEERLMNDPEIGASGLLEIIRALWEVNNLKNVAAAVMELAPKIGFKESSPQD